MPGCPQGRPVLAAIARLPRRLPRPLRDRRHAGADRRAARKLVHRRCGRRLQHHAPVLPAQLDRLAGQRRGFTIEQHLGRPRRPVRGAARPPRRIAGLAFGNDRPRVPPSCFCCFLQRNNSHPLHLVRSPAPVIGASQSNMKHKHYGDFSVADTATAVAYGRAGTKLGGMSPCRTSSAIVHPASFSQSRRQDRQIMPLMGVDSRRIYVITSAIGGALAGLASCLLVLQYDVQPFVGLTFGPITFLICVLGGLGNMVGGLSRRFCLPKSPRYPASTSTSNGVCFCLRGFCRADVLPPAGPFGTPLVKTWVSWIVTAAMLIALPFVFHDPYPLHILVLVLIWSFLYLLVDDGTLRAGFARPWLVHGHWRLCHRAVMELSPYQPVDRHSTGDAGGSGRGGADRLSLLSLPHQATISRC